MNTKLIFLGLILGLVFFASCKGVNKGSSQRVSFICVKDNDTLFLKIVNKTGEVIYVPQEFYPCHTNNDDTLHLESFDNMKYDKVYYYKYKKVFPFEFYTAKKIAEIEPDSVEKYNTRTVFYNQFTLRPFLSIPPDSVCFMKIEFTVPKYSRYARAVFYDKPIFEKERVRKLNYTYQDIYLFDSLNARYVTSEIVPRYH